MCSTGIARRARVRAADPGRAAAGVTPTTASRCPDDHVRHQRLRWERHFSRVAIIVTLAAFGAFLVAYGASAYAHLGASWGLVKAATFVTIVALLVYGALVYLCARLGYMRRRTAFRHASTDDLDEFAATAAASVCILVPS